MKAFGIVFYQNFQNDQASQVAVASPRTPIRNFCAYLAPLVHQICRFSASGQALHHNFSYSVLSRQFTHGELISGMEYGIMEWSMTSAKHQPNINGKAGANVSTKTK